MFPSKTDFSITGTTSETVHQILVPCRCTVQSIQATPSADPGDAETITIAQGGTDIGVLTFGTDIAAGATGTYVADSTNGKLVLAADSVVTLTITALTAGAVFAGHIDFDEYARTT